MTDYDVKWNFLYNVSVKAFSCPALTFPRNLVPTVEIGYPLVNIILCRDTKLSTFQ